jgi:hypothetical protein
VAVTLVAVAWAVGRAKQSKDADPVEHWEPPKELHIDVVHDKDKTWPYGEKLSEGKIHVKTSDVAPGKSAEDRVEATAPVSAPVKKAPAKKRQFVKRTDTAEPAKKPAAKKTADKKPAVKKAPAKKKST